MLLGCAAGRCPATTMLGLSLYQTHATDLEKPQIRRSRRWFGRPSHRRHSSAASTPAAPALCCTPSASQFPIEPAEPGAPIPRLPSLAAFERRPRCAWRGRRGPASETRHSSGPQNSRLQSKTREGLNDGNRAVSVKVSAMSDSPEHQFISKSLDRVLQEFSSTRLLGLAEADRRTFDYGCLLLRDFSRPLVSQVLWSHSKGMREGPEDSAF